MYRASLKIVLFQQAIHSSHSLRRVSYATCDPPGGLVAFLAKVDDGCGGPEQECHVFRAASAEEAEDLNALVGDAFRLAYATQQQRQQLQEMHTLLREKRMTLLRQSRSAESVLSMEEEPLYEDLNYPQPQQQHQQQRHQLQQQPLYTNGWAQSNTLRRSQMRYSSSLFPSSAVGDDSIRAASFLLDRPRPGDNVTKDSKPSKPNTLPVLNCLFAALNRNGLNNNGEDDDEDGTPYVEVQSKFKLQPQRRPPSRLGASFTQDDLRLPGHSPSSSTTPPSSSANNNHNVAGASASSTSANGSESSSGESSLHDRRRKRLNNVAKSKSAHLISR